MPWCQGRVALTQGHSRERDLIGDAKPRLPEAAKPLSAPVRASAALLDLARENRKWKFTHRSPTELYSGCTAASHLLLLTATPGQSGIDSHFARLQLLDPDRFSDLDRFVAEQRNFEETHELIEALRRGERVATLPLGIDASQSPDEMIRALVDQYGTGRVLFRNSRKSVSGFPHRVLHQHPLPPEAETTLARVGLRAASLSL
mgnify:CR=1 FL=1